MSCAVDVAAQPDRVIGQLPVLKVPATHVPLCHMQGAQSITIRSLNVVSPNVLPVFADARGSLQSEDVLVPVVWQVPKIERLRPLSD